MGAQNDPKRLREQIKNDIEKRRRRKETKIIASVARKRVPKSFESV